MTHALGGNERKEIKMSKKDYTKYSEVTEEVVNEVVEEVIEEVVNEVVEEVTEEVVNEVVEEVVEEVTEEVIEESHSGSIKLGTVNAKLNVRKEPSKTSPAVYIFDKGSSVNVYPEESTEDFYKVATIDVEGYCMKEFITIEE